MKTINLFGVIYLSFFVGCLTGCESENITQELNNDTYLSSTVPLGKVAIRGSSPRYYPYLGAGYDIMGDYLDNSSVKEPVLDMEKVPVGRTSLLRLRRSEADSYEGKNATEFLKSILWKNDFILPTENEGDLLFTGTINHRDNFPNPYEYSTQYSFASAQAKMTEYRHALHFFNGEEELALYLSDEFKRALHFFSPQELIETFGTHVLTKAYLGYRIKTIYRSVVADKEENLLRVLQKGLYARQKTIYTLNGIPNTTPPDKETEKNHGGQIIVGFHGGDCDCLSLNEILVLPNEIIGGPINVRKWIASFDDSNMGLTDLSSDDLRPIYDFITDPVKKQQVKDAVQAHIKARQLKIVETAPIFQASNGKHYRYFSSYQTHAYIMNDATYNCQVIASLYVKQEEGTVPLYRFSNENNDRLSLDRTEIDGMQYNGRIGYVYKESQTLEASSIDCVYEIWNGFDYAYTTEDKKSYGEKGSWKKTGVRFYAKKTSIIWN